MGISNNVIEERRKKYEELFGQDIEAKARAFDEIAENYYFGNFGTMQKSAIDTLMFSIYLDRILDKDESDMNAYSKYNLSRWLGITQSQVDNFKVKKQLHYPREYDWRKPFLSLCSKADYQDGNIMINIPDKNLYLEIKNALDEDGGFVETTLTANLLKVSEKFFILLLLKATENEEKENLEDTIRRYCSEEVREMINSIDNGGEEYSWKDVFLDISETAVNEIIDNFLPVGKETLKAAIEHIRRKKKIDKQRRETSYENKK